jgi:hypothetical protein
MRTTKSNRDASRVKKTRGTWDTIWTKETRETKMTRDQGHKKKIKRRERLRQGTQAE